MPLKAKRTLLATDGTIYCNPGTVLRDDDPVALKNGNAVVGSSEPVSPGFGASSPEPDLEPEPEPEAELTEQSDDEFLEMLAEQVEEEDEGVDL
jgi:hypothetical protein